MCEHVYMFVRGYVPRGLKSINLKIWVVQHRIFDLVQNLRLQTDAFVD